ncbi:spore germination protein KA [Paenibacillus qinlingensis]|uniref:Spore germination protein KA n=2 Tax=Paenibacillus qinlingensis TaxID=1837343 RepID=A0ABU1P130_9BACL|nr:spore germination protein KA [Paenibacillus qinlingensis]
MTIWSWKKLRTKHKSQSQQPRMIPLKNSPAHQVMEANKEASVGTQLEETITFVQKLLGDNDDFIIRRFCIFDDLPAVTMFFPDLIDKQYLNDHILRPLMLTTAQDYAKAVNRSMTEFLLNDTLYACEGRTETGLNEIIQAIVEGKTILLVDGVTDAFIFSTRHVDKRSITQPETEQVIRGAREGFIEILGTNLALLRYRLPTPDLRIKTMRIGRITKSKVAICFIDGIVNPALVEEVFRRLSLIDTDGILDAGYLEQFIEDNHVSPFPQIQNTERPDKAVANLLEGRVILLVDGSPFALILPTVFSQFYQTVEDYSERYLLVSFIRLSRLVALIFSLIFPSLYVALISFNPELIPTEFAVAVAGGRAGVPFPSVIEVLIMEISMEVLREATLRLPQQVGGALSIVGVLVVGQAAVAAGFISPITVVIIALTTIGSFATPAYNAALALRLLRFPLVILSGIFGLYGVMIGLILIANHMLSLRSFGVPYLSPLVPGNFQGMKDILARLPLWSMPKRPALLYTPNDTRVGKITQEMSEEAPNNTLNAKKSDIQGGT